MIVLDENINESQRLQLRNWHIPVRQIGVDLKQQGIQDEAIIPFLHQLHQPTFFTCDIDFFKRRWCHDRYCLVHLDVAKGLVATYTRLLLKHPEFDTRAKRMGCVIQVTPSGLFIWRLYAVILERIEW